MSCCPCISPISTPARQHPVCASLGLQSLLQLFPLLPCTLSFSPTVPIVVETCPIVYENLFALLDVFTYKSSRIVRPVLILLNARTRVNTQPLVTVHHLGYQDIRSDASRSGGQYELTLCYTVRPCHIVVDDSRFVTQFCGVDVVFIIQTEVIIASEMTRDDPVIVLVLSLTPY